jgi:hypothetical protein
MQVSILIMPPLPPGGKGHLLPTIQRRPHRLCLSSSAALSRGRERAATRTQVRTSSCCSHPLARTRRQRGRDPLPITRNRCGRYLRPWLTKGSRPTIPCNVLESRPPNVLAVMTTASSSSIGTAGAARSAIAAVVADGLAPAYPC